jgi:hypothetical protein
MTPHRYHRVALMSVLALALSLSVVACAKGDTEAPAEAKPEAAKTPEATPAQQAPKSEAKAAQPEAKVTAKTAPKAAAETQVAGHTPTAKKAPVGPIPKDAVEVEASCGQCNFGLTEPGGCDLAVRIEGKAYFVDGSKLDDHGDAHARRGMCNIVRRAAVTGKVVDDRYQATTFRIVD